METYQIIWLAQIKSLEAQMEGMKAENKHREICDLSVMYGENDFNGIANQLEELIGHMRNYG